MSLTNLQNSPKSNESTPIGMDYKPFGGGLFNDMGNEIWKDVTYFEGAFKISNLGNVIGNNGRTIKPFVTKEGYLRVLLRKNNKSKHFLIHRLVCIEFIPNPENKKTVNHINGIKNDNRLENLEWATNSENLKHAYDTGLHSQKCLHFMSKVLQLDMNGNYIKTFNSMTDASLETGAMNANISNVCRGLRKSAGGYKWKYA